MRRKKLVLTYKNYAHLKYQQFLSEAVLKLRALRADSIFV